MAVRSTLPISRWRTSSSPWVTLAARLRQVFADHAGAEVPWRGVLREQYAQRVHEPITAEIWLDECAQTCACLIAVLSQQPRLREAGCAAWLVAQADPLWRELLAWSLAIVSGCRPGLAPQPQSQSHWLAVQHAVKTIVPGAIVPAGEPAANRPVAADSLWITHFYEQFLAAHNARGRSRYGVYYTPPQLVRFMVSHVEGLLELEYGCGNGFSTASPLYVLDPAAGSGGFLVEVLELGCGTLREQAASSGDDSGSDSNLSHMLTRLAGWERLLPAAAVAQLNMAAKLAELGFSFTAPAPLTVRLRNSLAAPPLAELAELPQGAALVVIGNPPFSGVSRIESRWIGAVLRGAEEHDPAQRSYFHLAGRPLGERKVWLNDDYVKFYRLGQWLLDRAGAGILAFVSNHGFLDNITFRAMRRSLLDSFARLTVVDLHGNRKRHETTADGQPDANVFGIEQGTAVTFLRKDRESAEPTSPQLTLIDVRGSSDEKHRWLAEHSARGDRAHGGLEAAGGRTFQPAAPLFVFRPPLERATSSRLLQLPLNRAMPAHCTAPVTARDHFVVAFTRTELSERLRQFGDETIPDDEIRARYFQRTRSARYAAGDTRGWKLATARLQMAALADREAPIVDCLYRPFDVRPVFWTPWMIDWPRSALLEHLSLPGNWCLITRRQMLPGKPCNFFWSADRIALDGVIRSDNRGSELLLPIYVRQSDDPQRARPNFSDELIELCARHTGLEWREHERSGGAATFGPERLAWYLYALFHLPQYRHHFAQELWHGFPPVLVPRDAEGFTMFSEQGRRLRALHRLRATGPEDLFQEQEMATAVGEDMERDWQIAIPRFDGERIWINRKTAIAMARPEQWEFRVGAHQVCRKWLADRRGRRLAPSELRTYRQIVWAVGEAEQAARELAAYFDTRGGWHRLFV